MSARKSEAKILFKLYRNLDLGYGVNVEILSQMIKNEIPYKIPKNYIQWEELSEIIALATAKGKYVQNMPDNEKADYTDHLNFARMVHGFIFNDAPVFVVSSDLINVILDSFFLDENVEFFTKLLESIEVIYPNLLFLFPKDCTALIDRSQKSIGCVDHCFISLDQGKDTTVRLFTDDGERIVSYDTSIYWGGITTKSNVFSQFININKENGFKDYRPQLKDAKNDNETKQSFNLLQIVIQCLLLICSKPDLLITTESEYSPRGFSPKTFKAKKAKQSVKQFFPRILNLEYTEKTIKEGDNNPRRQGGSHSPKRPHWRLGYTVNKPIGKMKGIPKEQWERKLITVKPYLVRGNADQITNNQIS